MNSQTTSPASTRQIYRVGLRGPLVQITLLLGGLLLFFWLIRAVDLVVLLISAGVFAAIIGLLGLLMYFGVYLVLSEQGIRYQNIGFKVVSSWEHVIGLGSMTYNGKTYDCLLLDRGGLQAKGWLRAGLALRPASNALHVLSGHGVWTRSVDLDANNYVIPVGNFKAWHGGALYDEVRRRAPQAFLKPQEAPEG